MAALDPHIRGAERVREVFARVRNGDTRVADLYADDAVVAYSAGGRVVGREAIRAFYQHTIDRLHPQPQLEAILEAPPLYVAVVDVMSSAARYRAVDLFTLNDDGIQSLEIYSQGSAPPSQ